MKVTKKEYPDQKTKLIEYIQFGTAILLDDKLCMVLETNTSQKPAGTVGIAELEHGIVKFVSWGTRARIVDAEVSWEE